MEVPKRKRTVNHRSEGNPSLKDIIIFWALRDSQSVAKMYSRFGEKTNNLQECLPPRQTRPKRNASGFEKDLVPGTD